MFSRSSTRALAALTAAIALTRSAQAQSGVPWRTNVDAAKVEAGQTNRLLLIHFWRQTCGPCKVLDQTVFNQPHVGAAMERDYVPIKVDSDAAPALANAFRIEQVPTDVVVSPEGEVIAKLSCPNTADAYLTQLQTLARHFRQTKGVPADPVAQQGPINAAYADLPVSRPAAPPAASAPVLQQAAPSADASTSRYASPAAATTPAAIQNGFANGSAPPPQLNPYVRQSPPPGQAQAVYPPAQATAAVNAAPAAGVPTLPAATAAATPAMAAPVTPPNSMPRSYQQSVSTIPQAPQSAAIAQVAAQPAAPPSQPQQQIAGPPAPRTATPWVPQLPAGAPPLGLDGYCPVTLKNLWKWTPGNPTFGAIHRGRSYLFAGPQERDQFMADPDAYSPVFAGYDPVVLIDQRQTVPGKREFGYKWDDRVYLFSSQESMNKFRDNHQAYATGVRQAMHRLDSAGGPVRR